MYFSNKFQVLIIFIFAVSIGFAQETTGKLSGILKDSNNQPIVFANVTVVDLDTGAKYGTISQDNGYYLFNQLPPSSNYQLDITYVGYKSQSIGGIAIQLGKQTIRDITLVEDNVSLSEVVITVDKNDPIQNRKKGNEALVTQSTIGKIPTVNRSIQDITKVLPEANLNSFGGASNRFNNLNIDGISNNDVIGFQEPASGASGSLANGTPGSLSSTQPISYGAIKELSVKVAPFDASLGNFTGANINVVTKNGTNTFKGDVYAFGNNDLLTGRYANGVKQPIEDFYDVQLGAGLGGPIIKNKLFFYVNLEQAINNQPVLNAPGSATSNIPVDVVTQISDRLRDKYNYDTGTFTDASLQRNSTKFFARLDYNISEKHKLSVRNNYVNSFADNLEWNTNFFNFGSQGYRHKSVANSLVADLKSTLNNNTNNTLTVGYNRVEENRDFDGEVFPHLEIIYNGTNTIFAGTYREASVFGTTLNTFQINDKLTYYKNKHTFTFGFGAEYNDIQYRFLSAFNGRYQYRSVDDFLNDRPARIRGVYNIEDNDFESNRNTPSADFGVILANAYAQDQIRFSDRFSLLLGLRLDSQILPENLPISQEVLNTPEFSHFDNKISAAPQINPRLGFDLVLNKEKTALLRGGTGFYTGRIPFLWYAYAEYISGTRYFNIDTRPNDAVDITDDLQSIDPSAPRLTEINLIDNNFKLPREWKSNLAVDFKLPKNFTLSLEGTYSKVLKGLFFQSINRKDETANYDGADNRSYFTATGDAIKINPNFTNVFLLTNSDEGYRYNLTLGLHKNERFYNGYVGYTYGRSKDVSSTVRNSQAANFEFNQAVVSNDPGTSYSNFDLRHKIVSYHNFDFKIKNDDLSVGLIYNGRSGSPFSYIYGGDINRDGSSRNDVIYVPANANEINLVDITDASGNVTVSAAQQWQQLNNYINNDDYLRSRRGRIAERNGARTPWNHQIDLKLAYKKNFKKKKQSIEFTFDLLNLPNFLNKDWGRLYFVPNVLNSSFSLLDFVGVENNQPTFQFRNPQSTPWVVDNANSRWQAQFGLHYRF
ncbi:TonB-dependent receptor [Aquimarina rhabdastrellae]